MTTIINIEQRRPQMRFGTRIETLGFPAMGGYPAVEPETLTIVRPRKGEGVPGPGWHLAQFSNGGRLCMHETSFKKL